MENQPKTGLHTGMGIVSLVVGILALLVSFIPCIGVFAFVVAAIGIITGIIGYYTAKSTEQSTGLSLGGLLCSLLASFISWSQLEGMHAANRAFGISDSNEGSGIIIWIVIVIVIVAFIYFRKTIFKKAEDISSTHNITFFQEPYHIALNGQQTGPFTTTELKQKAQAGEFTKAHQVWKQGMTEWQLAGEVQDLVAVFAVVPPPPPTAS